MNNPRTSQANILLRDSRRGIQEGGEGEKGKERSLQMTNAVESEKNPAMVEHDEECFILKTFNNAVSLHPDSVLLCALPVMSNQGKTILSFQHSRIRHFKMKFLSAGKTYFALKIGFNHFAVSSGQNFIKCLNLTLSGER